MLYVDLYAVCAFRAVRRPSMQFSRVKCLLFVVCHSSFYLMPTCYTRDCAPAHSDLKRLGNGTLSEPFTASFSLLTRSRFVVRTAHSPAAIQVSVHNTCHPDLYSERVQQGCSRSTGVHTNGTIRSNEYTKSVFPAGTGWLVQIESLGPFRISSWTR